MTRRAPSLHVWLALALAVVIAVPVIAGIAGWAAAGRWQAGREHHREQQALALLGAASLKSSDGVGAVVRGLGTIGVEAQLGPAIVDTKAVSDLEKMKLAASAKPVVVTPGLQTGDVKRRLRHYRQISVADANISGFLWIPRDSPATRWAIALGAGLVALAAALTLIVVLLRRWVLRPLARLAADAERIAGGELDVDPLPTRAREVAQVGDALRGMAAGLRDALRNSAAAERERRFMVTAIAHDLRTPLFTLRGSLEAIERGIGDGAALSRAQAKAAHLDRLVGDLFAYARAEYANGTHAPEPLDLAEVARRAAETVEPGATTLDVVTNGPVPLRGDPVALQRALTNLLDNALRHARSRVQLRVAGRRLEVDDDGPGFAPDDLPHVFEPLFRGNRARSGGGGAGLGLAIARRLIHVHGGAIEAENRPQGGARVTVTLP